MGVYIGGMIKVGPSAPPAGAGMYAIERKDNPTGDMILMDDKGIITTTDGTTFTKTLSSFPESFSGQESFAGFYNSGDFYYAAWFSAGSSSYRSRHIMEETTDGWVNSPVTFSDFYRAPWIENETYYYVDGFEADAFKTIYTSANRGGTWTDSGTTMRTPGSSHTYNEGLWGGDDDMTGGKAILWDGTDGYTYTDDGSTWSRTSTSNLYYDFIKFGSNYYSYEYTNGRVYRAPTFSGTITGSGRSTVLDLTNNRFGCLVLGNGYICCVQGTSGTSDERVWTSTTGDSGDWTQQSNFYARLNRSGHRAFGFFNNKWYAFRATSNLAVYDTNFDFVENISNTTTGLENTRLSILTR